VKRRWTERAGGQRVWLTAAFVWATTAKIELKYAIFGSTEQCHCLPQKVLTTSVKIKLGEQSQSEMAALERNSRYTKCG
jgi:hypothetical protein